MDIVNFTVTIYKPNFRPKIILTGNLGNATVNGLTLTIDEARALIEELELALEEAEYEG